MGREYVWLSQRYDPAASGGSVLGRLAQEARREAAPVALVLAIPLVLLIAAAASLSPEAALLTVGVLLLLALLAVGPVWSLLPLTLAAIVASELARLALGAGGATEEETGFLGHGRLVLLMSAVATVRLLLSGRRLSIPASVVVAAVSYLGWMAFATLVAAANPSATGAVYADLQRNVGYASASLIALVATPPGARAEAARGLAWTGLAIAAMSAVYWGWAEGLYRLPSLLARAFEVAWGETSLGVAPRSAFPFAGVHPNLAATLFVMLAGLSAPFLARGRGRDRALLVALLSLTTAAVLSTQSRAGLAMLGVLGGGLVLGTRSRASGSMRAVIVLAVLAAGAVAFIGYERLPENRSLADTTTLESREAIWAEAWRDVVASPIVGHGLSYSSGSRYGPAGQSVHSDYLGHLVDGGVLGAGALLGFLGVIARLGWRASRRGGVDGALGEGVLLMLAVLATSMLVNAPLSTPIPSALLWLAMGIGASLEAEPYARSVGAPGLRSEGDSR